MISCLDTGRSPALKHFVDWVISNEAQVFTPRLHLACLRFELVAGLMEIELLAAEEEGMSKAGKLDALRLQSIGSGADRSVPLDVNDSCFMPSLVV